MQVRNTAHLVRSFVKREHRCFSFFFFCCRKEKNKKKREISYIEEMIDLFILVEFSYKS